MSTPSFIQFSTYDGNWQSLMSKHLLRVGNWEDQEWEKKIIHHWVLFLTKIDKSLITVIGGGGGESIIGGGAKSALGGGARAIPKVYKLTPLSASLKVSRTKRPFYSHVTGQKMARLPAFVNKAGMNINLITGWFQIPKIFVCPTIPFKIQLCEMSFGHPWTQTASRCSGVVWRVAVVLAYVHTYSGALTWLECSALHKRFTHLVRRHGRRTVPSIPSAGPGIVPTSAFQSIGGACRWSCNVYCIHTWAVLPPFKLFPCRRRLTNASMPHASPISGDKLVWQASCCLSVRKNKLQNWFQCTLPVRLNPRP